MEQPLALLMADLSGYTALTETHGAASAADLIDRYIEIVSRCLQGESRLQERTGDALMVIAPSADHLVQTAVEILKQTSAEKNFLQVHGGLHFGTVLKRGNSYFGSALNVTARIAARALPGSFWCSEALVAALADPAVYVLQPRGRHAFKNVSGDISLWELVQEQHGFVIDPVCRMQIHDPGKALHHPQDPNLFFCSAHCLETFIETEKAAPPLTPPGVPSSIFHP